MAGALTCVAGHILCSARYNNLGDEGAAKIAAMLQVHPRPLSHRKYAGLLTRAI